MLSRTLICAVSLAATSFTQANSPLPVDLGLSMDVATEEGKQLVFAVVRRRATADGFECAEMPTKSLGRDVIIMTCRKPAQLPGRFHLVVASDNEGLALYRIQGYFGGAPEPVSSLLHSIEHEARRIVGIKVRGLRAHPDRFVDPSEAEARKELAKRTFELWNAECARNPSLPYCRQRN
jgi:hypothetical protein